MLKYLLKTLIISTVLIVTIGWSFEKGIILKSQISGASKVNRLLNTNNKDEIPIFGSSRANYCYAPSCLGSNFHNYGIDGTTIKTHLAFLKAELAKDKNTPILLNIDLNIWGNGIGDLNNYLPNSEHPLIKSLLADNYKSYYIIPYIKYYGNYEHSLRYYLNERMELTKISDNGASLETNVLTDEVFNKLVQRRLTSKTIYSHNENQFKELSQLISEHTHRKIILVIAPYHESMLSSFENKSAFYKDINALTEYSNCELIDLSNLELPRSSFFDTSHLNYDGAVMFSKRLSEEIKKLKLFTN